MKRITVLITLTVLATLWTVAVFGAVPQLINFQGILKDGSGNPVADGSYSVTFKIYDAAVAGTTLWMETHTVSTTNGLFTVLLGSSGTPIPDNALSDTTRYLGIAVAPDAEMTPRQRLVSVGYGYRVNSVDEASGGDIRTSLRVQGSVTSGNSSGTAGQVFLTNGTNTLIDIDGSEGADGGAAIKLDNSSNVNTIALDADDITAGDNSAILTLKDGGGDSTVVLDASQSGEAVLRVNQEDGTLGAEVRGGTTTANDGGVLNIYNAAGFNNVTLDGIGTEAQLFLRQEDGTSGVTLSGGSTANGSTLFMRNAAGSSTISFDADQTGNGAVVFPIDAISATEELEEPGVASTLSDVTTLGLSPGFQNLLSRTITVPATGYVLAMATAEVTFNDLGGTTADRIVAFGVSDVSLSLPANQDVRFRINDADIIATNAWPVTVHGLFSVAAGSHTFYFVADGESPTSFDGTIDVADKQLSLIYFPTAYGTVTPTVAAGHGQPGAPAQTLQGMNQSNIAAEQAEAVKFNASRIEKELAQMKAEREALEARLLKLEEKVNRENPAARDEN